MVFESASESFSRGEALRPARIGHALGPAGDVGQAAGAAQALEEGPKTHLWSLKG